MPYTVPNQRVVTIHREKARSDFLGIKNENWQSAARDLGAHLTALERTRVGDFRITDCIDPLQFKDWLENQTIIEEQEN